MAAIRIPIDVDGSADGQLAVFDAARDAIVTTPATLATIAADIAAVDLASGGTIFGDIVIRNPAASPGTNFRASISATTGIFTGGGVTVDVVKSPTFHDANDVTRVSVSTTGVTLAGDVNVPTAATATSSTIAASTAYVSARIASLLNAAPAAYDTLGEIATQLATDGSAVSALTTTVAGKLAKASNLSDLTDAAAGRGNLGLGSAATKALSDFAAAIHAHAAADITSGVFDNARTTATTAATASAIVLRDSTGRIPAGAAAITGTSTGTVYNNFIVPGVSGAGFPAIDFVLDGGASGSSPSRCFRVGNVSVAGTRDIFFQCLPDSGAGFGYLETWAGAGQCVGTGNATPVHIRPNRTTTVSFVPGGGVLLLNQSEPATPTGGGVVYVQGGALKFKGSGGLVTTLAAAS